MPNAQDLVSPTEIERARELFTKIEKVFDTRVVGQQALRRSLVVGLVAGGHVLLESVPGLAKTTAAQTLAQSVNGTFHRIQCTPDLMPNDIIGTQVLNYQTGRLTTQLGPVHANIVLLDEINRSSAKTQSAMLEAMQERQTTIGGVNHQLPKPFMVMATQNPIEEEGTYVLPEAQMDRFLLKEIITYPQPEEELEILSLVQRESEGKEASAEPISLQEVEELQEMARRIFVHDSVRAYIVDIINTTRGKGPRPIADFAASVRVGASPRGGIALMQVAQVLALIAGRGYVIPDDIAQMRYPVLRHRLVRSYDALANGVTPESLIDMVFNVVPVP